MKNISIFLAVISAFFLIGCGGDISKVKNYYFEEVDNSISFGNAIDNYSFFESVEWNSFETKNKRNIVEIICKIDSTDVKASYIKDLSDIKVRMDKYETDNYDYIHKYKYEDNINAYNKLVDTYNYLRDYYHNNLDINRFFITIQFDVNNKGDVNFRYIGFRYYDMINPSSYNDFNVLDDRYNNLTKLKIFNSIFNDIYEDEKINFIILYNDLINKHSVLYDW